MSDEYFVLKHRKTGEYAGVMFTYKDLANAYRLPTIEAAKEHARRMFTGTPEQFQVIKITVVEEVVV